MNQPPPPPSGVPSFREPPPETYEMFTRKPVIYLPVLLNGGRIGFLWASVTDRAAGFLRSREFLQEAWDAPMVWNERLQRSYAQGLPAREAIRAWIGEPEDPRGGGVPSGVRERVADALTEVEALADPTRPPGPGPLIQDGELPDGTPVDRSKGWGPLHFEVPPSYDLETDGPVRYFPVVKGSVLLGYLWASVAGNAAFYMERKDSGMDGVNAGGPWIVRLRELYGQGVPAIEALARCRAEPSPGGGDRAGAVPPDAREEELPSLEALARLASRYEQSLPIAFNPAPDDTTVLRRPPVPDHEREALVRYLEQAPVVWDDGEPLVDAYDLRRPANVPNTYHTDGTWVWLGGVPYHLHAHGVAPAPDLVEHVRARGFRLPEVGADALAEARRTLEWNGLLLGPPPPAAL
ncbi:hypothetical protein [Actinomadura rugatobispora]|uniref:Uncharacterized protein n=1 Tax=Actinomadura rugatobispora TaxID=1994 RepID=A0ABW0ZRJ2_9ACTN|nr:hypothetical protein GCM10010200_027870 [Actinomadura rugatobispora]